MKKFLNHIAFRYRATCTKAAVFSMQNSNKILLAIGLLLLGGGVIDLSLAQVRGQGPTGSFTEANYDDELVRAGVGNLFRLIEGAFGALIMVVAGLGAIIAAAMGAYRAALGMLVVALGAFILRALVSLFFGQQYDAYSEGF
jgi:hypothetical protein